MEVQFGHHLTLITLNRGGGKLMPWNQTFSGVQLLNTGRLIMHSELSYSRSCSFIVYSHEGKMTTFFFFITPLAITCVCVCVDISVFTGRQDVTGPSFPLVIMRWTRIRRRIRVLCSHGLICEVDVFVKECDVEINLPSQVMRTFGSFRFSSSILRLLKIFSSLNRTGDYGSLQKT